MPLRAIPKPTRGTPPTLTTSTYAPHYTHPLQSPAGQPTTSATMPSSANPPLRPIKILMLHGFTQSGPLFHAKTKALEKQLHKALLAYGGVELHYPSGPMKLRIRDLPGYQPTNNTTGNDDQETADPSAINPDTVRAAGGDESEDDEGSDFRAWWRKNDATGEFVGLSSTTWPFLRDNYLIPAAQEGNPFLGVIGFSQGASLAAILASIMEAQRKLPETFLPRPPEHPPFLFAVCYSGFKVGYESYKWLYNPKITTPTLHVIGSLDTVVDEQRSVELSQTCGKEKVVYHPGGHYLPSGKMYVGALVGFIVESIKEKIEADKRALMGEEGREKGDDAEEEFPF